MERKDKIGVESMILEFVNVDVFMLFQMRGLKRH